MGHLVVSLAVALEGVGRRADVIVGYDKPDC